MAIVVIPKQYTAVVLAKKQLTPKMFWLSLRPAIPVPFTPGQYASWLIGQQRRPLSIASHRLNEPLEFVVDVSPHGTCSQLVEHVQPGESVTFMAPYGRFVVDKTDTRPLLFIATGSGIAPIRAHIYDLLASGGKQPIRLFFGNRDQDHMFLTEEFSELVDRYPTFSFIPVLSEPSPAWTGQRGLVTTVVPNQVPDLPAWSVYVCGSPQMVKDTIAMLQKQGVPKEQIHSEEFK